MNSLIKVYSYFFMLITQMLSSNKETYKQQSFYLSSEMKKDVCGSMKPWRRSAGNTCPRETGELWLSSEARKENHPKTWNTDINCAFFILEIRFEFSLIYQKYLTTSFCSKGSIFERSETVWMFKDEQKLRSFPLVEKKGRGRGINQNFPIRGKTLVICQRWWYRAIFHTFAA